MSQNENPNPAPGDASEPTVGSAIVPVWMVVLCGVLFYWCQLYLADHAGGFNKEVYAPYYSYDLVKAAQPQDEKGQFLAQGQVVFHQTCELCHQATGLGKEGQFPPLMGSDWVKAQGPNRFVRIVLDGITGPVTVSGKVYDFGSAAMLPFRTVYSDEQLAAVLSYVRQTFGDNAPAFKADQIKAIRAETSSHRGPWTPDELLRVPVQ